jgi:hypothetical protein
MVFNTALTHYPLFEVDLSVRQSGHGRAVGNHHHAYVPFGHGLSEQVVQGFCISGIQVSRGFVGQKEGRSVVECPRNRHPLLFSAGKGIGLVVQPVLEAKRTQQFFGSFQSL